MFFVSSSYAIDDLSQHHGLNDGISSVKLGANTTVCFHLLYSYIYVKKVTLCEHKQFGGKELGISKN
jgi:hypothetical protein